MPLKNRSKLRQLLYLLLGFAGLLAVLSLLAQYGY